MINEDRCHLNGLAMVEGEPGYVTACSRSDLVDGWRDRRIGGGIVIDVASHEIICTGLSMPHSPRWYQDKLWLHNSGRGELGYIDLQTGKFEAVAFCPGYLRGLAFWENYAIVGLSKPRNGDKTFSGLPLDDLLQEKDGEARCGLMVIDLKTGAIIHWVRFEGQITELYDVQILPNVKRPMALGFKTEEIAQLISLEPLETLRYHHSSKTINQPLPQQPPKQSLIVSPSPQSPNNQEQGDPQKKIKFLFLIGVEGTGHHMIRAVLAEYFKQDNFIDQGNWHNLLSHYWDAAQRVQIENETSDASKFQNIKEELEQIFQEYKNQNITHLFESTSFPYCLPRQSLRRPDIIDFADLVNPDLIETKYLILYRNPVSTTYSAIRRGFTDNIYLQAKIVESNLIYIEKQFSQLPKTSYKTLHFEEFLDNPKLYSQKLSDWWDLDPDIVLKGLENLRQPLPYSQIPVKEKEILEKFFTQKRINQWESFYQSNQISSVAKNYKKLVVISQHHDGGFFSNFNKVLHLLEKYNHQGYDFKWIGYLTVQKVPLDMGIFLEKMFGIFSLNLSPLMKTLNTQKQFI